MKTDDLKNKAFDELLKIAANEANAELIDEMPPCEEVEFSKEHENKMRKLFAGKVRRKKIFKRIVILAAAMILVLAISVFSVKSLRIKFMNFVLNYNETNTEIRYKVEEENKNSYTVGDIELEYIPLNFTIEETRNMEKMIYINFSDGDKSFFLNIRHETSASNLDTQEAGTEVIVLNGIKTFISEKDGVIALRWNSGVKVFALSGNIERKELIKIAENIKIK